MENTRKTNKFLIYVPLIVAGILCIAEIILRVDAYLSFDGKLQANMFNYVINWRLFIIQILICLLPLCLIFLKRKKTSKKLYKVLMIASFIIIGLTLLLGLIYLMEFKAYLKGNSNADTIIFLMTTSHLIPGAALFESIFILNNFVRAFLQLLYLGNTIFIAILAMKLSKTGKFVHAPQNIYQLNQYAAPINARYQTLSTWQENKSFDGSPAALVSQELILDTLNNTVGVKVKFQNTDTRNISAIKIDVNCYDPFKTLLGTCHDIILMDINAAPGVFIDISAPIMLPYNQTRNAEIILKSVSFTDGTVWENETKKTFEEETSYQ